MLKAKLDNRIYFEKQYKVEMHGWELRGDSNREQKDFSNLVGKIKTKHGSIQPYDPQNRPKPYVCSSHIHQLNKHSCCTPIRNYLGQERRKK